MARYVSVFALILTVASSATPVAAQSFLNGDWVGTFHEDQPERGPGPELGDYLGHPRSTPRVGSMPTVGMHRG